MLITITQVKTRQRYDNAWFTYTLVIQVNIIINSTNQRHYFPLKMYDLLFCRLAFILRQSFEILLL